MAIHGKVIRQNEGATKSGGWTANQSISQHTGIRVWQRNYYEHIVRSENELNKIREYISNNPLNWEMNCA